MQVPNGRAPPASDKSDSYRKSGVTIPNFITIARIFAVPLIVYLVIGDLYMEAAMLFVVAGISDAVDGFIAKRFNATSDLGAYLDPVADKALLVSIFLALGFKGALPIWLIIAAVSRDILIVGGVILSWMLSRPIPMRPSMVSKLNTVAQIVLIALVLGARGGFEALSPFTGPAIIVAGSLTTVSAAAYVVEWLRHMAGVEESP